jgi:hypothetical protein
VSCWWKKQVERDSHSANAGSKRRNAPKYRLCLGRWITQEANPTVGGHRPRFDLRLSGIKHKRRLYLLDRAFQ